MAIAQLSKSCGSNPLGVRVPHPPLMALFKKENKEQPVTSQALRKQVQVLEEKLEGTLKEVHELREEVRESITKIGITRFNPFKEIGGDQSFSIALLNDHNDGVVVTSYYGREMNRVYAKQVAKGASESSLAKEEIDAIAKAMKTQEDEKNNGKK